MFTIDHITRACLYGVEKNNRLYRYHPDPSVLQGAKVNPSNNAGDRPWHWAENMRQTEMMAFLENVRTVIVEYRSRYLHFHVQK